MAPLRQLGRQYVITAALFSFIFLACAPFEQLRTFNQQRQIVATSAAILDRNSHLVADAYEQWQTLPGYRLESRTAVRHSADHRTEQWSITETDSAGNVHLRFQTSGDQVHEFYVVDNHTYRFEPAYDGWIDLGPVTPAELQQSEGILLAIPTQIQLLTQFGTVPTKVGRETIKGRPTVRYKLAYIATEIAEAFDQELADPPVDLRGMIWIDQKTGALLKAELLLYEDKTSQPVQEFVLEVDKIGNVEPITLPAPVVDPEAIVSATATAQAWTVLTINSRYQEEPVSFELIPIRVTQAPVSSPGRVEVQLLMRRLPETLFQGTNLEQFLSQLRQRLSLSVPNHNLLAKSTGAHIKNRDPGDQTAEVAYFFNADLVDVTHVELVISGEGNPLFAPVPVEEKGG